MPAAVLGAKAAALGFGLFVHAAYLEYAAHPADLNPPRSEYPQFPAGYALAANLQMSDFIGGSTTPTYYGFIARKLGDPSQVVVAIRGTDTAEEWWDDFDWRQAPFSGAPHGGQVAGGFDRIYRSLRLARPGDAGAPLDPSQAGLLPPALGLDHAASVAVAGHSLGAALATLYGLGLAAAGQPCAVYTLASPKVGDQAFSDAFNAGVAVSVRVYDRSDPVPDFPQNAPPDLYVHVKGGLEVNSLTDLTVRPDPLCYHSHLTYLYLLGAPRAILGGPAGCGMPAVP
ncbi:MAG TPA: lipase family protein [bacterium]|nr:lipase family protein [bacterium]